MLEGEISNYEKRPNCLKLKLNQMEAQDETLSECSSFDSAELRASLRIRTRQRALWNRKDELAVDDVYIVVQLLLLI